MAYDEELAGRVRAVLKRKRGLTEKKMFGGIAFMIRGNMCCGVTDEALMARVGPDQYPDALSRPHAREMDFTGKPMKGFVHVAPEGFASDEDLKSWVAICEKFVDTLPSK